MVPKVTSTRAAPMAAEKMPVRVRPLFRIRFLRTICRWNPNRRHRPVHDSKKTAPPPGGGGGRMASAGFRFSTVRIPLSVPMIPNTREMTSATRLSPG